MTPQQRRQLESLDRSALEQIQIEKLNRLLAKVLPANDFYAKKFHGFPTQLQSVEELRQLPMTTKEELAPSNTGEEFARNKTFPLDRYCRFHQTSGTRGRPLSVVDTAEDWEWFLKGWHFVLDSMEITSSDRALLAFSFGPFIGFWSAFDALAQRNIMILPSGGMSTMARVDLIERVGATALFCTPTYALRLAETAAEHGVRLDKLPVKKILAAGEPGASVPAVRKRMEDAWAAKVYDHCGATEVGPWGYADIERRGLHVVESEFIAEFISVDSGESAEEGELSQLILTPLGRSGCPVFRYRTGDLVRPFWSHSMANRFVFLEGGVLGRADDMMVIRGVNIFPSSIDQILRGFPEVVEYRITALRRGELDELAIEVEDHLQQPERISEELQLRLGLKVDVRLAATMSLPRTEHKAQRFIDRRNEPIDSDSP